MSDSAFTLLVPSCDAYSDTWPYFFHFLFKYWPTTHTKVNLITNELTDHELWFITIMGDSSQQWGDHSCKTISQAHSEFVMLMMDNFAFEALSPKKGSNTAFGKVRSIRVNLIEKAQSGSIGTKVENTCFRHADAQSNSDRKLFLLALEAPELISITEDACGWVLKKAGLASLRQNVQVSVLPWQPIHLKRQYRSRSYQLAVAKPTEEQPVSV